MMCGRQQLNGRTAGRIGWVGTTAHAGLETIAQHSTPAHFIPAHSISAILPLHSISAILLPPILFPPSVHSIAPRSARPRLAARVRAGYYHRIIDGIIAADPPNNLPPCVLSARPWSSIGAAERDADFDHSNGQIMVK
jgi:hypothetical protein